MTPEDMRDLEHDRAIAALQAQIRDLERTVTNYEADCRQLRLEAKEWERVAKAVVAERDALARKVRDHGLPWNWGLPPVLSEEAT